jgi:uncharacterized protein
MMRSAAIALLPSTHLAGNEVKMRFSLTGRRCPRRISRWIVGVAFASSAIACGTKENGEGDAAPVLAFNSARMRVIANSDTLRLLAELATRPEQRTLGLMERRHLADTAGMLFTYPDEQTDSAGFWMFRTRLPLDIAFMDSNGVIRAIKHMVPCTADIVQGCPSYPPGVPYRAALEMSAGYFERHKVALGARLMLGDTTQQVSGATRR